MLEPSEEATPTVSVVVPTYRRPDALATTLDALLRVDFPKTGYEIVVVDDGSDATTEEVVTGLDAGDVAVQYIPQANSGAASARNTGARAAKGELLLFCDDDIILEPDHLRLQVATRGVYGDPVVNGVTHFSDRAVAILRETPFGRYRLDLDRTYQDAADGPLLGNDCYEAPLLSACNLAISRDRFWEIGGFDEAFPFAGAEDQALSLRARAAGLPLIRNHRIQVFHNDQTLSFRQFCLREERSAQTFVVLVRRFPDQATRPLFAENAPISRGDGLRLSAKKLIKSLLRWPPLLALFHRVVNALERLPASERVLRRAYRSVLALHINRGVRLAGRDSDE